MHHSHCSALVTGVARGCLSIVFAVVVCPVDVGKSSLVFLTDAFQEVCLIVVVRRITLAVGGENFVVAP